MVTDTPGGCGAFQRDLNRLHKLANLSLRMFSQGNCKVLCMSEITPCTSSGWSLASWISALQKRIQGILLATQLPMNQQLIYKAKKVKSILGCPNWQVKGYDPSHLFSTGETQCSAGSGSGLPRNRNTWTFWNKLVREPQRWGRTGAFLI